MKKDRKQIEREALDRAEAGMVLTNYPAIFQGFMAKGVAEADIKPRENVFTYHAWKALGRYVRKGEHGVKVVTYVPVETKEIDRETREKKTIVNRRPWTATVFHISQTEPLAGEERKVA